MVKELLTSQEGPLLRGVSQLPFIVSEHVTHTVYMTSSFAPLTKEENSSNFDLTLAGLF